MTTIPDHCVSACSNIEARLDKFDVLNDCNILRGEPEEVKKRLSTYRNGALLVREYDYWRRRDACCTCYWAMVYDNLPQSVKGYGDKLKTIYYTEIACNREKLMEANCLTRLVKQQTEPFLNYAYIVEDDDGGGLRDCLVQIVYRTQSENRPRTQIFERMFPEGSVIRNKLPTTNGIIGRIVGGPEVVKVGDWS